MKTISLMFDGAKAGCGKSRGVMLLVSAMRMNPTNFDRNKADSAQRTANHDQDCDFNDPDA